MDVLPLLDAGSAACAAPLPAEGILGLRKELEAELGRARAALERAGWSMETPCVVLADDATCARFFAEPPRLQAARVFGQLGPISAWTGRGTVSGDAAAEAWVGAAITVTVDAGLRTRLEQRLPHPLPPVGARVVLVNLDALQALECAVRPPRGRRRGMLDTLACLVVQREVLRWQLGAVAGQTNQIPILDRVHADWLRHRPDRRRFTRLQRWFGRWAGPRPGQAARPPLHGWLDDLHDVRSAREPWRLMVERLRKAGLSSYQMRREPPAVATVPSGMDGRLAAMLRDDHGGERPEWAAADTLGVYVRPGGLGGLPPGVHLFVDRIETAARDAAALDVQTLAWHVLWHELGHWRLDREGADPTELLRLAPVNHAEVFCEVAACRALEAGENPSVIPGLAGPALPCRPILAWRANQPVYPYSLLRACMLPQRLVGDQAWLDAAVTACRHLAACERAWSANDMPGARGAEAGVQAIVALQLGRLGLPAAGRLLTGLAADRTEQSRPLRPPVVFFWSTTQ